MKKLKNHNILKNVCILFPGLLLLLFMVSCGMSPEKDPLKNNVIKADLIVLVTCTDEKYEVEQRGQGESAGIYMYTIYTLSVEKLIKGKVDTKEIFLKVSGGPYQPGFEFEPHFNLADRALICLKNGVDNNYLPLSGYVPNDGLIWRKGIDDILRINSTIVKQNDTLEDVIERVMRIMRAYDIPIAKPTNQFSA